MSPPWSTFRWSGHGPWRRGEGDGPLAGNAKDVWGAPIRSATFTLPAGLMPPDSPGHDSRHLFTTILTGVGGTPMPVFEGQLEPAQVWDLVHYAQSLLVDAQEQALLEADLAERHRRDARRRIWESLSSAAARGDLDDAVVDGK